MSFEQRYTTVAFIYIERDGRECACAEYTAVIVGTKVLQRKGFFLVYEFDEFDV